MKIKTNPTAGGRDINHNQTARECSGLRVKANVKAGGYERQHNQTITRESKGMLVKTSQDTPDCRA